MTEKPLPLLGKAPQHAIEKTKFSDDRFRLLVEAIEGIEDYAIFMLDAQGYIATWNAGAERIKGYKASEIIGKHFSTFYTPEDLKRNHPAEELIIVKRDGKFQEEGWRVKKDGSRFWASVLITRLTDAQGNLIGYSKVTRDLTERKAAEEALRASEERFRLLVEGVKDYAIFLLDPKGIVSTWNEGAQRLMGYTPHEIIGQHFSRFYTKEEIDSGKCEYELKESALTGRFEDEGWRVRKDGTLYWANVVLTALRDGSGRIIGYSKVTRDLTERKRAEERLRRANEDLEKRVVQRTAELSAAKEALEVALKARDDFLSIASHELKTPITALSLQLQILKRRIRSDAAMPASFEIIATTVEMASSQTKRLTQLIENLLDVTRVELGQFTFNFEKVDLSRFVQDVANQWEEPLRAAGCALRTHLEPGISGQMDVSRLEQVFSNLFSNIIKYARGKPVEMTLGKQGNNAVICIHDSGPGIDPTKQSTIFERYSRATAPTDINGFGLGLFISKTIIEAHGGSIALISSPGQGTTFTISLPLNLGRIGKGVV